MTGEMHCTEVTREAYPLHFAAADLIPGATVEPFDQYQGPFIRVPGRGRFFLSTDYDWGLWLRRRCRGGGCAGQWFDESAGTVSNDFFLELDDNGPTVAFMELIEGGGTAIDRNNPPDTDAMLKRLDQGIAAEHAAMDRLFERIVSRTTAPSMTKERALAIVREAASEYRELMEHNNFRDSERDRTFTMEELNEALEIVG